MWRKNLGFLSGNILVLALTDMLGNFARSLVFPYASLYILALGGDATKIGFVSLLGLLAGLFVLPIAGYITDHSDRIKLLVLSGFLSSFFLVWIVFAPSWQAVAAASLLFGLVVFQFPAYASLVADSLSPADRGRGIGFMNTISNSIALIAPFIAGILIEKYTANLGMRILYGCMFVIYLVSTLIQFRFLRENSTAPRTPLKLAALTLALGQAYASIPALVRQMSTPLKAVAWVILLSFLANGVASAFWVVYAIDEIGLSAAEWGLILLVEKVVGIFAFMFSGILVDRWGRKTFLLAALMISLATLPLFFLIKSFTAVLIVRIANAVAFALAITASTALIADLVPLSSARENDGCHRAGRHDDRSGGRRCGWSSIGISLYPTCDGGIPGRRLSVYHQSRLSLDVLYGNSVCFNLVNPQVYQRSQGC